MNETPDVEKIAKLLIELIAEQYDIEINYEIQRKEHQTAQIL